jgi:hypothetical protein
MEIKKGEQAGNLMNAMKNYQRCKEAVEAANANLVEALNKLKNASGATGSGDQVFAESTSALGRLYMKENG